MKIVKGEEIFKVINGNDCILESLHNKPIIYVGKGKENVDMYRGNFKIEDYVTERIPLLIKNISKSNFGTTVQFGDCVYMDIHEFEDGVELEFTCSDPEINRFWIRVEASKDEYIFGCGEQMSYFNLRGRNFPIWTSEPGVGRDKSTYITWRSDVENKAGGDYYNTNYPQPTFISSKHYYLHVDSTAYSDFNFKNKDFHEICIWEVICLFNNKSPMTEHNHWPLLWAKCNYEALRDTNNLSKIPYFMRAGGTGSQKYCTLLWAGDQSVDFSRHDGIGTVIVAALSAGICGMGLTHSDIGGYTSLFGNIRTKELFLRWAEMCAFSMVMRTHEGNRPDENYQFYDDEDGIAQMARLTDIYTMLKPYLKELSHVNALTGIPAQRPLFIHYEDDKNCYDEQSEYLLGEELLAAPVIMEGVNERKLYLPKDRWIHIWSGKEYVSGVNVVEAPIGYPPVFYKKEGKHETLFREITDKYGFAK